jgi:hypothetical protein
MTTVTELCHLLKSIGVPYFLLGDDRIGHAVMVREGGRVLALAPTGSDENVLWLNPNLERCRSAADLAKVGAGGIGGLRLWQAPEAAYMWNGSPDPTTFSNYQVQPAMDPGNYSVVENSPRGCTLSATLTLRDYRSQGRVTFSVRRIIEIAELPMHLRSASKRGLVLRLQHHLRLLEADDANACVDLWHLLQLPAGTVIGAPLHSRGKPVPYFNESAVGPLKTDDGFLLWETDGARKGKIGLRVGDVLGGPYGVRRQGDRSHAFLWNVPRWHGAPYVDAPPHQSGDDHLLQFWDGFGFCEVEYHTPGVFLSRPELTDASELTVINEPHADRSPREILRELLV